MPDNSQRRLAFTAVLLLLACGSLSAQQETSSLIRLNAGAIDTAAAETQARRQTLAAQTGKQLHLVQFSGPVQPAWVEQLVRDGFRIVNYIPDNAYLVYGEASSLRTMQTRAVTEASVHWEGPYRAVDKIQPGAKAAADPFKRPDPNLFAVQLVRDAAANAQTLAAIDAAKLEPVIRQSEVGIFLNLIVRLPVDSLDGLAARPDVVSIAPYNQPKMRDERQGMIVAGQLVANGSAPVSPGYTNWLASKGFTQAQFDASGFVVDVTDSGVDTGNPSDVRHFALYKDGNTNGAARLVYARLEGTPNNPGSTTAGLDGHGNINAHIIAGQVTLSNFPHTDTNGYRYGQGIAPFVKVGSSVIFDPNSFTFPNYADLASRAYSDGARVSGNSWGANVAGDYGTDSQEYDALVRDAQPAGSVVPVAGNQEMTFVFAAGNDGSAAQTVGSPGTAKNVITVGAAENVQSFSLANGGNTADGSDGCGIDDTGADNANDMIDFSSRGPCTDNRVKPDIVAPGTHITGGVAQDVKTMAGNGTALTGFDATGVCALPGGGTTGDPDNFFPLGQQFYTTSSGTSHSTPAVAGGAALVYQWFINNFSAPPSPAMLKAFLMNAARYMNGTGANDNLYSNNQGMGMMNLGTAFDGTARFYRDQLPADLFTASGQTRQWIGYIPPGGTGKPFRVTLAWTDAPGSTTGNAYVNNLNLVVTVNGISYLGNNFNKGASVTGGAADPRNNVESVFLPAGTAGNVVVTVVAANIAGEGVPNIGQPLSQDFALVAYNFQEVTGPPGQVTGLQAAAASDTAINLSWTAPLGASSYWVRRNGVDVTNVATTTYQDRGLTEQTTYAYAVVASNVFGAAPPSDPASATTLSWVAANPYGFRVTNPTTLTTTNATNYVFSGQMGEGLTSGIVRWTNVARATSGYVTPLGTNWSQLISLFAGTNRVIFSTTYPKPISTNFTAYDGAGDWAYQSGGWVTGANGGYGFGPWSNTVTSSTATLAATDEWTSTNMKVNSFYGFALRASAGSFGTARRSFAAPLAVGSSFTINFDSNLLDAGRSVGFSLADSNQVNRFTFFAFGGTPNVYGIRDGAGTNTNTGITYTTSGLLPVTFTLVTSNSYRFVAGTNAPITNALVAGGAISRLVASNASAGSSIDNAFYLGDMSILSPVTTNEPVRVAAPFVVQPVSVSTDGIPNAWWETYFPGNTAAWVAANDSDSDGQSNAAEYTAGTSPVDASSKFAITSMVRAGNNTTITWSAVGGKIYSVESNGSLAGTNWQSVPPNVTNSSGATNLSTNVPIATPEGFLRVLVAP